VVSLSSKGMSDNTLTNLMGNVPTRCILLLEDLDAAFTRSVNRDSNSTGIPTTSTSTAKESNESSDGSTLSLSGLLNILDGVAAAEGRLLFATTNHIERLDPALSRPGRMDVWVNFTHATKWQAEGIFKCFFPYKPSNPDASNNSQKDASQKNLPGSTRKISTHTIPLLTEEEISALAKRFAAAVPEKELSVASLQGYLLKNKMRPRECVDEVAAWVIQERETREKMKKEKAEREAKEKKEAEEKEKKEKEEKEAKEKEEKEAKEKAERKEARAKAKKASTKTESSASTPSSSTGSTSVPLPTPPTPPTAEATTESSASSSSESETTTGVDADTEESMTSEDETEANQTVKTEECKKEKWVAVKGCQTTPPPPPSAPTAISTESTGNS